MLARLKQQGGFAYAGVARKQHNAARYKTAAKHPVKLAASGVNSGGITRVNLVKRHGFIRRRNGFLRLSGIGRFHRFFKGVPLTARWTLTAPLGADTAANGTFINGFLFWHNCTSFT